MYKCICGNVCRNISGHCNECGRTLIDNLPFSRSLELVDITLSVTACTRKDREEIEKAALALLASGETLEAVSDHWKQMCSNTAKRASFILENLYVHNEPEEDLFEANFAPMCYCKEKF